VPIAFLFACLALGIWGHWIGYLLALGALGFIPQHVGSLRAQIASIKEMSSEVELQRHLDKETQRRGWKSAARQKITRDREIGSEAVIEHTAVSGTRNDLQTREMARRLESALQQLSFEHRSVIDLSGLEGLSPDEVAPALGIPVGTVHSRLSRARAKLKELVEAEGAGLPRWSPAS